MFTVYTTNDIPKTLILGSFGQFV